MNLADIEYEEQEHDRRLDAIRRRNLAIGDVVEAVAELYVTLYDLADASAINNGMCEEFAEDVCTFFPGAIAYWNDELGRTAPELGSHKVIAYQGRYYDSLCLEGTKRWRKLMR